MPALRWSCAWAVRLTLPIVMTDVDVAGEIVAPLALGAQLITPAGQAEFLLNGVEVVGGSGLGTAGVGNGTFCGSSIRPSSTLALPLTVNAVTLFAVHAPTPERGVDSEPWIVVGLPISARLPLVPT